MTAPDARWLFSARQDVALFGGSAVFSVLLVLLGRGLGAGAHLPTWAWVLLVLCIDVAHVWGTLFRVYLDPLEVRRRRWLYLAAPCLLFLASASAYLVSPLTFWRLFAYAAVWHFVRQQVGWMALYGRRSGSSALERRVDEAAIYAATLGPLVWWHANLPRPFEWFVEGDFVQGLPQSVGAAALVVHSLVLASWLVRQLMHAGPLHQGKLLLVGSTWVVWFGGIVLARNDFAFTAMNVVSHGIPYDALVYRYARGRQAEGEGYPWPGRVVRWGVVGFALVLLTMAYLEELGWDVVLWHEHPQLFGALALEPGPLAVALLVAALALPQATHYLLDGFVWRSQKNPLLAARLGWARARGAEGR